MVPKTVMETYELVKEIGSGGGGVVYLANHLRLNKKVVLKKYTYTGEFQTNRELLRREVDVLKDLRHAYIPQVYDFVTEHGVFYAVMDYIEGESLEKHLKKGERFPQAQVIHWAIQVLQALCYLHSPTHGDSKRGFVHSDIKPANLMLRPNGDICLIDFNIALAIGEKSVIGISEGYASPEYYALSKDAGYGSNMDTFLSSANQQEKEDKTELIEKTELVDKTELLTPIQEVPQTEIMFPNKELAQTELLPPTPIPSPMSRSSSVSSQSSTSTRKFIIPDARSDIYSLGATLYHLLSGHRPAKDATDVVALSAQEFSPQIVEIIMKAMAPNPDLRYQTAQEMLFAFEHLYDNDPRMKRHRRQKKIAATMLAVTFVVGGGFTVGGLVQMEQTQAFLAQEARQGEAAQERAKMALAAIRDSEAAYQEGDIPSAQRYALEALQEENPYWPQAQKALTDALGVYDLKDGLKAHVTVELPSEALKLSISPNGTRIAVLYAYRIVIIDTETGEQLAELSAQPTAMAGFCFLQEDILLYAGEHGISAYDIAHKQEIWRGQAATWVACSADGKRVAGIHAADSQAIVYDSATGVQLQQISFSGRKQNVSARNGILADPENSILALNGDGSVLAVSFEGGGLSLFHVEDQEETILLQNSEFPNFKGGFSGSYFAFSAWNTKDCTFAVTGLHGESKGTSSSSTPFLLCTDEQGIYLAQNNTLVELNPVNGEMTELAHISNDMEVFFKSTNGFTLVGDKHGHYAFFNDHAKLVSEGDREKGCELMAMAGSYAVLASRNTPTVQILKIKQSLEAQVCRYSPDWKHIETRVSADGSTVMFFHPEQFYLISRDGNLLNQTQLPNPEQMYDQQYRRQDGNSWLEVTYQDGLQRAYSAKDGSVLWERQGEKPDESLEEQFETTRWLMKAPLHEAPTVYDKKTGQAVKTLEQDSYLTYVTEVGDYLVTQYLSGQGKPYGLLLNQDCETLAYLPDLCDVIDQALIFDDGIGNVRKTRIYKMDELMKEVQEKGTGGN